VEVLTGTRRRLGKPGWPLPEMRSSFEVTFDEPAGHRAICDIDGQCSRAQQANFTVADTP
jgi:hypothetical protein